MQYSADEGVVIYSAKDDKDRMVFDAPEWLAAMCSHVPNRGEQTVRYYGWYSNVTRGKRQKLAEDDAIPCIIESDRSATAYRKSWARLIQKIYEVDPLTCPNSRNQQS
ncbi:MAG: transposase [bacterium]